MYDFNDVHFIYNSTKSMWLERKITDPRRSDHDAAWHPEKYHCLRGPELQMIDEYFRDKKEPEHDVIKFWWHTNLLALLSTAFREKDKLFLVGMRVENHTMYPDFTNMEELVY